MANQQRNVRRPTAPRANNAAQNSIRIPKSNVGLGGEPAAKRRRPIDVPFGALNLDQCRENPPSAGMPPNVSVTIDERPPQGSVSPSKYLTEDEDSDVEMIGEVSGQAERRKSVVRHQQKAGKAHTKAVPWCIFRCRSRCSLALIRLIVTICECSRRRKYSKYSIEDDCRCDFLS